MTEIAATLWHEKAAKLGSPPPVEAFDLSRSIDWSYRFMICGSDIADSVFLMYGSQFARLLRLPEKPNYSDPVLRHLPARYRPLFSEGCETASDARGVAKFNGAVINENHSELYRAAFMPLRLRVDSLKPIVFGSFNYHRIDRVPEKWRTQTRQ